MSGVGTAVIILLLLVLIGMAAVQLRNPSNAQSSSSHDKNDDVESDDEKSNDDNSDSADANDDSTVSNTNSVNNSTSTTHTNTVTTSGNDGSAITNPCSGNEDCGAVHQLCSLDTGSSGGRCVSGFAKHIDLLGHDLHFEHAATIEECAQHCVDEAECELYQYVEDPTKDMHQCYLKKLHDLNDVGLGSYSKIMGVPKKFALSRFGGGLDFRDSIETDSGAACERECAADTSCNAYTFLHRTDGGGTCELKRLPTLTTDESGPKMHLGVPNRAL